MNCCIRMILAQGNKPRIGVANRYCLSECDSFCMVCRISMANPANTVRVENLSLPMYRNRYNYNCLINLKFEQFFQLYYSNLNLYY